MSLGQRSLGAARRPAGSTLIGFDPYNLRMRLILASISPRRRDLLGTIGVPFEVMPGPRLNEDKILSEGEGSLPSRMEYLATLKGERR